MVVGAGFFFTSCNNAEPEIDDRDAHIEVSLSVGGQFAFGESGFVSDNKFVGDVVDNLTLSVGNYGFRADHVGSCVVKNSNREYHFVVTSSNQAIDPVLDWGISQDELIEVLGEASCEKNGNDVVFTPTSSKPVPEYVYTFDNDKLQKLSLNYIYDGTNPIQVIQDYMTERYIETTKVEDEVTTSIYYNALTIDAATVIATSVEEELEGEIPGSTENSLKITFYSAAAYKAL
ncbi:MAG: hypothetical protein K2H14_08125, partial [Muribaculaceae bacterium]|nr:hypothetical protein [Muribaculaceae bacterium]